MDLRDVFQWGTKSMRGHRGLKKGKQFSSPIPRMIISGPSIQKNKMGRWRMKRLIRCFFQTAISLCVSFSGAFSGSENDAILGKWLTENGQAIFEFYRVGSEYRALLVPLKNPESKDINNPIDSLKGRKLRGATIIYGLNYDEKKKQWLNGWIYNPQDGKTYHCFCALKTNRSEMLFRGYLGVKLLGQSQIWKRVVSR
jgi:uncharacterized protein (DUF2147 family)